MSEPPNRRKAAYVCLQCACERQIEELRLELYQLEDSFIVIRDTLEFFAAKLETILCSENASVIVFRLPEPMTEPPDKLSPEDDISDTPKKEKGLYKPLLDP